MGRERKIRESEKFLADFAVELDIFDSPNLIPDWVFRIREQQLDSINAKFRKICQFLKDAGVEFKIKWPLTDGSKWKYADIWIPKTNTVVLIANFASNFRPIGLFSDRGMFFAKNHRVWEIEDVKDLSRKISSF